MGRQAFNFDWLVFIPTLLLICLGLVTLLSIQPSFFYQQLLFTAVGIAIFLFLTRIDFNLYQFLDTYLYIGCIVLLLLSFLGPEVRGATRWLDIGIFRFQPSELVKPLYLLFLSSALVKLPPTKLKNIGVHVIAFFVPFFLVFSQPDLGSSLVYAAMWIGLLLIAGIPLWLPIVSGITFVAVMPILYALLHDYQRLRVITFLNPLHDPQGAGYNAIQSMISVGSGQLFGRGFGRGTQSLLQFLPERHTDFVFASFAEEFGFIGSIVLLLIFFFLLFRLLQQAQKTTENPFAFFYVCGFFIQLFTHVIINIGMNIGILPITGITLPLISYGGSSLITTWIGLGLFMSAIQMPKKLHTL